MDFMESIFSQSGRGDWLNVVNESLCDECGHAEKYHLRASGTIPNVTVTPAPCDYELGDGYCGGEILQAMGPCSCEKFVAPMEAEPRRAGAADSDDTNLGTQSGAFQEVDVSKASSAEMPTASKPLEDDELDLGNEGYPFSTEDEEERNGR